MLCLYLVFPILIALGPLGVGWRALAIAYAIWVGVLALWGLTIKGPSGERFGWPLIAGMFLTIVVVPIIALILKASGLR